jgi:hypothetical protein
MKPSISANRVAGLFFPQSRDLGIDLTSASPELQRVVVTFGADCSSFYAARDTLWTARRLDMAPKEIERICHRLGQEREAEQQALVARFEALPLAEKEAAPPQIGLIPQVAVVQGDGGRFQQRLWDEADESASSDSENPEALADRPSDIRQRAPVAEIAGVASPADAETPAEAGETEDQQERKGCWREDKNGVLLTYHSAVHESDPAPQIPEGFLNITAMGTLSQEIKNARRPEPGQTFGAESEDEETSDEGPSSAAATYAAHRPELVGKQVVATAENMSLFGLLLAAHAWIRGFFAAKRRAFLGDGLPANWTLWRTRFPTFTPILDFIHLLTYVYAAAFAGQTREAGTRLYRTWIQWAWSGRVDELIAALEKRLGELPPVEKGDKKSPQAIVFATLRYIRNNRTRMNYPEYRRLGLPITTSAIESTVKQINYRVKGTEKFWSQHGIDAMLRLRSSLLSDFDTLDDYLARRESNASGLRSYRPRPAMAA